MKRCLHWWRTGARDDHGKFHCRECWARHWNAKILDLSPGDIFLVTVYGNKPVRVQVTEVSIGFGLEESVRVYLEGKRVK